MAANYAPDVGFAWWLMERFWIRYAQLATERGMDAVIAYPIDGPVPAALRDSGIELLTMPIPGRGLRGILRVLRFIRKRRVRVLYLTDRPFTSVSHLLYRMAGVRWIVNHDHTPGDRPPAQGVQAFIKWIWRRLPMINADRQLCVSPLIAQRASENALIPKHRTVVVQNGIDELPNDTDPNYASREFNLPETATICVTVARATSYKGLDFVIQVASRCTDTPLSSIYFIHCGDGPELEQFKRLAETAGVSSHVIFAGKRADVAQILHSADLALHPSKGEAFSLSVLEYMRAGLVLFVPDTPSVCQAVTDGETGIVYPAGDVNAMMERLSSLVPDRETIDRLGDAAKLSIAERYSSVEMMRQFDSAVYDTLAGH